MRFIKRLVFIFVLLVIAFFVYRLISPLAAKSLLFDLKSFSNSTIGTHFSLSGDSLLDTGTILNITGVVLQDTGGLQELTGDDEFFLIDEEISPDIIDTGAYVSGAITGIVDSGSSMSLSTTSAILPTKIVVPTPKTVTVPKKVVPVVSSSKENRDLDKFLQNFGN